MPLLALAATVVTSFACAPAPTEGPAVDAGTASGGAGGGGTGTGGTNPNLGSGGSGSGGATLPPGTGGGGSGGTASGSTGGGSGTGGAPATGGATAPGTGGGPATGSGGAPGGRGGVGTGTGGGAGAAGSAGRAGTGTGGAGGGSGSTRLVHPGGLLSQADLDRMRANVAAGTAPWSTAWNAIRTADANTGYQPSVAATITVEHALQNQGHAAYVLAVKWAVSGDPAFATAAKRVLDAWVNTVTSIESPQRTLRVGIGAVQMANAAEIIAHGFNGGAGWPASQVAKAKTWFSNVVWPTICAGNLQRSSNWGTSALAGCMSVAIFVDDPAKYQYAVNAYKNGFTDGPDGCAGVAQYICNASGQATEAGRDQGHPQGGVGHLVEVALMAWNQGLDLVSFAGNRVVAGMEYLAKYNLGNDDVPYDPNFPDLCNVHPSWSVISTVGRGSFSPVYEMASRLFTGAGKAHPYTIQVLRSAGYRPERTNSDHPGMGTLSITAP